MGTPPSVGGSVSVAMCLLLSYTLSWSVCIASYSPHLCTTLDCCRRNSTIPISSNGSAVVTEREKIVADFLHCWFTFQLIPVALSLLYQRRLFSTKTTCFIVFQVLPILRLSLYGDRGHVLGVLGFLNILGISSVKRPRGRNEPQNMENREKSFPERSKIKAWTP